MGLGKTLQSICILAGKHHERAERFKETKSPDAVHLPSLIVCPPTLTGHWYYEIKKYAESLTPIQYVGNARDRNKLLPKLKNYDIVITSYEVVRNDITHLEKLAFNYCILDEGHIIKNAKTKLTKAVKCIRADHRLVLSGTPIQNHALDLWSLFDFLMPGFLGTEGSFNERFSKPILANRDGKNKNGEAGSCCMFIIDAVANTSHQPRLLWRHYTSRCCPSCCDDSRKRCYMISRRRSSRITSAICQTCKGTFTMISPNRKLEYLPSKPCKATRISSMYSSRCSTSESCATTRPWCSRMTRRLSQLRLPRRAANRRSKRSRTSNMLQSFLL